MGIGLGQRTRNMAILAGALTTLVSSLPDQPTRDQIRDIAAIICEEASDVADELDGEDDSLSIPGDGLAA